MKAFFYAQHLLGSGHVVRAAAIARALAGRGVAVRLVIGNDLPAFVDLSDVEISRLPTVRAADASFTRLVDGDGNPVDERWRERRRERLTALYALDAPDILITETFPFGRRQFAFELFPLIEAARGAEDPPLIAASVRDILVRKDDLAKERWMADTARAFFDLVLVHADPAFVRFEDSFPFTPEVADLLRYTGYVHLAGPDQGRLAGPDPSPDPSDRADTDAMADAAGGEVIVSCGGGPVGGKLMEAALAARAFSGRLGTAHWRILVAPGHGEGVMGALRAAAPPGVLVEPARADFPDLLKRARLSISQAGYNTVLDVLTAGVPSVLVPFEEEGETEQLQRAQVLVERGIAVMVQETALTPRTLAQAADRALDLAPGPIAVRTDGAAAAAEILIEEARRNRRG